ncbi:MAG: hypothetical protein ABSF69_13750 [Polyangiaceae bacterium]|jgi:hypothetical protein
MPRKRVQKHAKADFVRSLGPHLPARSVVAKAKAAGFALTEAYVSNVRGAVKATTKSTAKATAPVQTPVTHAAVDNGASAASVGVKSGASAGSVEVLLKAVAAEIGFGRAFEILVSERAIARAAIGA